MRAEVEKIRADFAKRERILLTQIIDSEEKEEATMTRIEKLENELHVLKWRQQQEHLSSILHRQSNQCTFNRFVPR